MYGKNSPQITSGFVSPQLKELAERQRQINRNKALKKGLDPEALSGKYPVSVNPTAVFGNQRAPRSVCKHVVNCE